MIQGRCPTCSRRFEIETLEDLPTFPFCSQRCRLIDLGRWADGSFVVPGAPAAEEPGTSQDDPDDSE